MVPLLIMAKLTLISSAPSVHYSIAINRHTMWILLSSGARYINDKNIFKSFDLSGLFFVVLFPMSKLEAFSFTPRINVALLTDCHTVSKSCCHFWYFWSKFKFDWFWYMVVWFVAMSLPMSAWIKPSCISEHQRNSVSCYNLHNLLSQNTFRKFRKIVKCSISTRTIFIMSDCIQISWIINQQRVPIACSNQFYFIFEWNNSWHISVLSGETKLSVLCCSPAINLPITSSTQIIKASTFDIYNILALKLFGFCRSEYLMFLIKEHAPNEDRAICRYIFSNTVIILVRLHKYWWRISVQKNV